MRYFVTLESGRELPLDVSRGEGGTLRVTAEGRTFDVAMSSGGSPVSVKIGSRVVELWVDGAFPDVAVTAGSARFTARVESERARATAPTSGAKAGEGLVKSPMPGRVVKVLVAEGDEVQPGTPLVVVEAMKMENELSAKRAGRVLKVHAKPGATVEGGAKLVEIG